MTKDIFGFTGKYRWLSNFPDCEIEYEGFIYPSPENAYQAAKTINPGERAMFLGIKSSEAKKLGRKITMRDDWDDMKDQVMYDILSQKFRKEPFRTKLIETGTAYIEETNWWNDTYWGICKGVGENKLGKIITLIREELILTNDA